MTEDGAQFLGSARVRFVHSYTTGKLVWESSQSWLLCELDDISVGSVWIWWLVSTIRVNPVFLCQFLVLCLWKRGKRGLRCRHSRTGIQLPQMLVNGVENIVLQTVEKHGDRTSNQVLLFNENKKLGLETLTFYLSVNSYVRDTNWVRVKGSMSQVPR